MAGNWKRFLECTGISQIVWVLWMGSTLTSSPLQIVQVLFTTTRDIFQQFLMALVGANHHFVYVDIGKYGSNSDGNVFKYSKFGMKYMEGKLNTPPQKQLPNLPNEGPMASCNCQWWGISFMTLPDETLPKGERSKFTKGGGYFKLLPQSSTDSGWKTLLAFWLNNGEFLTEEYLLNQGTRTLLYGQQFVCIISLPLTRISMKISAQLNPENIPCLEDKGLIRYLPRLHGYHASRDAQGIHDIFKYYLKQPTWSHTMAAPKSLLQTVTILHNITCLWVVHL